MKTSAIRRRFLKGAAATLAAAPLAGVGRGESARAQTGGRISHGIAMHGEPALPPDFRHLPYANPDAPRGGRVSIGYQGTFDSLNPYNLKAGSTSQGLTGNIFQTLMTRSTDEPFTLYCLVAESVETDAARSYVQFRLRPEARFSDGAPVTSADIRFTFDQLKTKGRPQQRAAFSLVKAIDTTQHTATLVFADGSSKVVKVRPDVVLKTEYLNRQLVIRLTSAFAVGVETE